VHNQLSFDGTPDGNICAHQNVCWWKQKLLLPFDITNSKLESTQYYFFQLSNQMPVPLTQHCTDDKTQKNEMGGLCNACEVGERRVQGFGGEI
jgi:hypothetical protein